MPETSVKLWAYHELPEKYRDALAHILLMPPECPKGESVVEWISENCLFAALTLAHHRKWIFINNMNKRRDPLYSSEQRNLSEMPLCNVLHRFYNRIAGFQAVDGSLVASEINNIFDLCVLGEYTHTYGWNPETEEVVDLTFPQFLEGEQFQKPGDRTQFVVQHAPELIHLLPENLSVLYGRQDQISEQTGVSYSQTFTLPSQFLA